VPSRIKMEGPGESARAPVRGKRRDELPVGGRGDQSGEHERRNGASGGTAAEQRVKSVQDAGQRHVDVGENRAWRRGWRGRDGSWGRYRRGDRRRGGVGRRHCRQGTASDERG